MYRYTPGYYATTGTGRTDGTTGRGNTGFDSSGNKGSKGSKGYSNFYATGQDRANYKGKGKSLWADTRKRILSEPALLSLPKHYFHLPAPVLDFQCAAGKISRRQVDLLVQLLEQPSDLLSKKRLRNEGLADSPDPTTHSSLLLFRGHEHYYRSIVYWWRYAWDFLWKARPDDYKGPQWDWEEDPEVKEIFALAAVAIDSNGSLRKQPVYETRTMRFRNQLER